MEAVRVPLDIKDIGKLSIEGRQAGREGGREGGKKEGRKEGR